MEFEKRHDTTDATDFCPRQLVTDLLRICYGETGLMDFGLKQMMLYGWRMLKELLQETCTE